MVDGEWVHVSGTTGFDYATTTISGDVVEQAEQCLANIGTALAEAGSGFADVVRVRYMLANRADVIVCGISIRVCESRSRPPHTSAPIWPTPAEGR